MTGLAIVLFVTAAITAWGAWALYVNLDAGIWTAFLDAGAAIAQVLIAVALLAQS